MQVEDEKREAPVGSPGLRRAFWGAGRVVLHPGQGGRVRKHRRLGVRAGRRGPKPVKVDGSMNSSYLERFALAFPSSYVFSVELLT